MSWSKTPPTEPGWYWIKCPSYPAFPILVVRVNGELRTEEDVGKLGRTTFPLQESEGEKWWSVPIQQPHP